MVQIENKTERPVLLSLNSGTALHLAPGTTSEELPEAEVDNNPKVQKLREQRIVAVHTAGAAEVTEEAVVAQPATGDETGDDAPARPRRKPSDPARP
ncbi:MAG: hypothetical protein H7Y32_05625 [Chloroflexales bacterium]|nr:hypothetical protein [Chloroflexales bacterium]